MRHIVGEIVVFAIFATPGAAQLQFDATLRPLTGHQERSASVALGDVNGDGCLDLVFGNVGRNQIFLNDGTGTFINRIDFPTDEWTSAVVLGDVDSDGDLDVVFGNLESQNQLYLNNGTGSFTDATAAGMPTINDRTNDLALGDVNGNGHLDLVVGNQPHPTVSGQNRLYLNDGTGTFADATAVRMPIDGDYTEAVALGDVNGDSFVDLVFGNDQYFSQTPAQNRLYLNDGTGTFTDATAARMPTVNDNTQDVVLGDIDSDGYPDLICANTGFSFVRICANDGNGHFTDVTRSRLHPDPPPSRRAIALGDMDSDGDSDLVFAGWMQENLLYLQQGNGIFVDCTQPRMPRDQDYTGEVALGDIDDDGDLDMVFPNDGQPNRLYVNLLRQLDAPSPARVGSDYRLDLYACYGPSRSLDVAFPHLSFETARIPMPPLGTLGLGPELMVALPPVTILQPTSVASTVVIVPDDPGLAGLSFHLQALLIQWPGWKAHFTNVISNVVQ